MGVRPRWGPSSRRAGRPTDTLADPQRKIWQPKQTFPTPAPNPPFPKTMLLVCHRWGRGKAKE